HGEPRGPGHDREEREQRRDADREGAIHGPRAYHPRMNAHAPIERPSAWVERWAALIRPGGEVLDVACGRGRHSRYLAQLGVERPAVGPGASLFRDKAAGGELGGADHEAGPWPYAGRRFGRVVVPPYLHRPLLPTLVDSLAPAGVLVYETFAQGNERFGKPS